MPRKKAKLKTAIGVVVDESGSMQSRAEETRVAFNNYFDDMQKEDPTVVVTAANFSERGNKDSVRFLAKNQVIADIPYLDEENYRPDGYTPLFDAVAHVVNELSNTTADRYLVVILTDGFENASKEYNNVTIKSLIAEKEATDKWTFVYLGAGKDSWGGSAALGISTPGTVSNYSGAAGTTATVVATASAGGVGFLRSSDTKAPNLYKDAEKKVTSKT